MLIPQNMGHTTAKRTEKVPNISLSFDFVNKPLSIKLPPREGLKSNKAQGA